MYLIRLLQILTITLFVFFTDSVIAQTGLISNILEKEKLILSKAETEINQGHLSKGKEIIKTFNPETEFGIVYSNFIKGRIAESEMRYRDARDIYREILNNSPDLARARLHLAVVLRKLGDEEGAKHNFEMLALGDIDKNLSEKIKTEINGLSRAKRWQIQTSLSFAPTSNVTSGTFRDNITIGGVNFTPDIKQKSGFGIQYGIEANYLQPIKDDVGLLYSFSTMQTDFSNNTYDDRTLRLGFGPQFYTNSSVTTLEAVLLHRRIGRLERGYSTGYGAQLTSRFLLNKQDRMTFNGSIIAQNYDVLKYQDGFKLNSALTYDKFTSSSSYMSFTLAQETEKTHFNHLNYQQFGGSLGYYFETPFAFAFFPSLTAQLSNYSGIFPLTDIKRKDHAYIATLAVLKKNWLIFGLAPKVSLLYKVNKSNIELYEFSKFDVNLNFTKQF
jgi:outer membrane protein